MNTEIEGYLKSMVQMRKTMNVSSASELKWCCFEELVLKFGVQNESAPRPKSFRKGTPKQCFANSAKLAMRKKNLIYVEGYGVMKNLGIPLLHAWVVERGSNKVIDVTTDNFDTYVGIKFSTSYLKSRWNACKECFSMFDDFENDFPLLRMEEAEILQILDRG